MKKYCLIPVFCLAAVCYGQDSTIEKATWEVNGYLKSLQQISFEHIVKQSRTDNLLHNRVNVKWMPSGKLTFTGQFRNRVFWGDEVKRSADFSLLLKNENEKLPLRVVWVSSPAMVVHSNTERLYADYHKGKWNVRFGRQRINWGVATTWNPNDVFNSYNFLDFDYEERPGVDAVKLQYALTGIGTVELAYAAAEEKDRDMIAARFSANKWMYDLHALAGVIQQQFTLGAGWAGSIHESGFKGEVQYYFQRNHLAGRLNAVVEWDRVFKKGWYTNAGLLFNSRGIDTVITDFYVVDLNLTPKNLMPTKWNIIATASKEISPLLSVTASVLYTPGSHLLILLPTLRYDLATNLTADLVGQSFFANQQGSFRASSTRSFLRMKWNF